MAVNPMPRKPDQMFQNPLKPSPSDFRSGSIERRLIITIQSATYYGLIKDWHRAVQANDRVNYAVTTADGAGREWTAKEMFAFLDGMISSYRLACNGTISLSGV